MEIRGRDIRAVRQQAGVSQKDLAERLGISVAAVVDLERERFVPAQPSMADVLAAVGKCAAPATPNGSAA